MWGKKIAGIFLAKILLPLEVLAFETTYGLLGFLGSALQRAVFFDVPL